MSEAGSDMSPRRGLGGFLALSGANKWVLAEALAALSIASLAIRLLPFRTVVKAASAGRARPARTEEERTAMLRCRWAVESWAERVPWRTVCFQKGLAFHFMLRRRGIDSVLHYGVMQNAERGLTAHVWVSESEAILMGGETAGDYTRLASYPAGAATAHGKAV